MEYKKIIPEFQNFGYGTSNFYYTVERRISPNGLDFRPSKSPQTFHRHFSFLYCGKHFFHTHEKKFQANLDQKLKFSFKQVK
jgi:hypothetical protein